jgi:outer membrane protein assembly factor BamD (BamD/ComL family)
MGSVRLAPLAALVTAAALAAPAFAGDIVINQQGKALGNPRAGNPPAAGDFAGSQWEIVDETLDGVTYRIPDVPQPQTLPASAVKAVYHDPETIPADLARGRAAAERGDWAGARDSLSRVAKDAEALPWAKAEAAFLAADSFVGEGNAQEGEKALAAFKAAFPKSKWITTATARRANALMALEKIDEAKAEYASLKKLPGVSEDVGIESDFWLVWIDEQVAARRNDQNGLNNALKGYEALMQKLSGKSQYEGLARRAQVGRASCLILLGKAAEAKTELEKLAKESKDPRVLASIYNKLGLATWRAAPADKTQLRQALFHYLRVVTLYSDEPGTDEDCAEAMFHAGELFRELKDQGPDWLARARREWNDVIARYPGTEWSRRAKEALVSR